MGFGGASTHSEYTNGDHDDKFDLRRINSVGYLTEDDIQKKAEVDTRVANYVSDQLQRMRTNDSAGADAMEDEIEASFDGANGH
jgi:hypothetical protein